MAKPVPGQPVEPVGAPLGLPSSVGTGACASACADAPSIERLNRDCYCVAVNQRILHAELEAVLGAHGLPVALADSHPNLFSALPVYVAREHLGLIADVVRAVEEATALPAYRSAVLAWAAEIAGYDPGSPGGLLGLDFHLGPHGPRLIEINTNPGGVLLNAVLGQALRACMPEFSAPPTDPAAVEDAVLEVMLTEWRLQRGAVPLECVAIVDASPDKQYL
uniref:ATP-grasp domain-containing protein n=1 Tax=uncultured Lysobacteraceae bacterium TaxID=211441 RepID=J9UGQ9_9GAMM|nr:hypothetical protein pO3Cd1.6 [uncultured Xanthomonadaceae bacterium]